ncbi:MAG: DUF4398 domain-containing protein [Thiohalomonadaceae bacterium]
MMTRKILYATVGLALALAACGGPDVARPSGQIDDATVAMERARQANAHEFAAFEMAAAERKLDRARNLADSDEDDERIEARRLAEQVTVDARLAEAKARLAQSEDVKAEMNAAVEALRDSRGGAR